MDGAGKPRLAALTPSQAAALDEHVSERYGIPVAWLMEAAGGAVADLAQRALGPGARVVVLAGPGNNGGDALAAARRLAARGVSAEVGLSRDPQEQRGMVAEQLRALRSLPVQVHGPHSHAELGRTLEGADLVLDGLLGFSSSGPPRREVAALIELAMRAGRPTLAIDLPSGMDPLEGTLHRPHIRARWTAILTYPKTGHLAVPDPSALGEVWALDVGVPEQAFADLGLRVRPLFRRRPLRRLRWPPRR